MFTVAEHNEAPFTFSDVNEFFDIFGAINSPFSGSS